MQTGLTLAFADGEYYFRLPIRQIVALEQKAGPIGAIKNRLITGEFSILDITETIRHALIGGGRGLVNGVEVTVSDLKANHLVATYVDDRPLGEGHVIAQAIIAALYVGYDPATQAQKKSPAKKPVRSKKSTGASFSTTA